MKKRLLAFVLALSMVLSFNVAASDTDDFSSATAIKSTDTVLASGSYYLSDDITLDDSLVIKTSGTVVNLYLNGHVLTGNGTDSVIEIQALY